MTDEGLFKGNILYWTTNAYKYTFIILSGFLPDLISPPHVVQEVRHKILFHLCGSFGILPVHMRTHTHISTKILSWI